MQIVKNKNQKKGKYMQVVLVNPYNKNIKGIEWDGSLSRLIEIAKVENVEISNIEISSNMISFKSEVQRDKDDFYFIETPYIDYIEDLELHDQLEAHMPSECDYGHYSGLSILVGLDNFSENSSSKIDINIAKQYIDFEKSYDELCCKELIS